MIVLILAGGCSGKKSAGELVSLSGLTMGTTYSIKIIGEEDGVNDASDLQTGIDEILLGINRQMSMFMEDSEISRFNRSRSTGWFEVSRATAMVLNKALEVSRKSAGAFDITVGPLINLWGFGVKRREEIPADAAINEALMQTGYRHLSVRFDPPAVKKAIPELYCDLSSIAKGYGVDRVAEFLESIGVTNYMVEIGGEVRTKGKNPQKRWWRIGIATPNGSSGLQKIVHLRNTAMATSGDYRNYFEKEGIRYSHTVDPSTGRPITHTLASVTVIHPSCTYADAMATAINVLGPEKGYQLAVRENLPTFLIIRRGDRFIEKATPRFERFLLNRQ